MIDRTPAAPAHATSINCLTTGIYFYVHLCDLPSLLSFSARSSRAFPFLTKDERAFAQEIAVESGCSAIFLLNSPAFYRGPQQQLPLLSLKVQSGQV